MALKIRMARGGTKKRPYYRIVVADSRMPRDGRFIEKIGTHNPLLAKDDPNRVIIDLEKAKEWIGKGAKPSDRVARFLSQAGVMEWTHGNNPQKGEPGEKAKERAQEKLDKDAAAKEAEAAAKAEADAPADEAPEAEAPEAEASTDESPAEETASEEAPTEEEAKEE